MKLIEIALSTWALVWVLSFWHKTDPLRFRLGIYPTYDDQGYQAGREDAGGLGAWVNCPLCAAVLVLSLGWLLRKLLAPLGLVLLVVRWWEGARIRREWWL